MKLAAIDIGSNAIRLQVIRVISRDSGLSFKKLEYIRFPLRLGKEVFQQGALSPKNQQAFEKLMRTFKLLIDLYEVEAYLAAATSALREAANGPDIVRRMAEQLGVNIEVITGEQEAEFLSKAIIPGLDDQNYLHIDVGGGSTELNLYTQKKRMDSRSFRIGSVRKLKAADRREVIKSMQDWCRQQAQQLGAPIRAIGTGGNIRKLLKLANYSKDGRISLTELQALKAYLSTFSYDERVSLLKMNPDRADVIIPASEIYIEIMKGIRSDQIQAPNVGLKDGLLYALYERQTGKDITEIEFVDQF